MPDRRRFIFWFALLAALTICGTAWAEHPSVATFTSSVVTDATPDCLTLSEAASGQELLTIDNRCADAFVVDAISCNPVECMPQGDVRVEPETERRVESFEVGVPLGEMEAGDVIDVEIAWSLGAAQGTVTLSATFEGFTGGEHNFNAATNNGTTNGTVNNMNGTANNMNGAANNMNGTANNTAGTNGDGDPNGGGPADGDKAEPGCGGCSSIDGSTDALLLMVALLLVRRKRGDECRRRGQRSGPGA